MRTKTMLNDIPPEIVTEILTWLPVKSLLRFRSVCKSWHSLIFSTSFVNTHLLHRNTISNHSPQLLIKYSSHYQELFILCGDDETLGNEYVKLECPFENPQKSFKIVGSCNGLLCLLDSYRPDNIFLWNPSVRKLVTLPVTISEFPALIGIAVGFGFDPRSNDYKVVKVGYALDFTIGRSVPQKVEVYALSTRSWRCVRVDDDFCYELRYFCSLSAFVNGAVHWVAFVPNRERGLGILTVVAFDMSDEVFREIALPHCLEDRGNSTNMYATVLGESLAVIQCGFNNLEIWVMEEYGVIESWTERCTIFQKNASRVVGFRKNGDALVAGVDVKELVSYEPQSQQFKHLGVYGFYLSFYVVPYMDSLVAIDGDNGAKKVHPNSSGSLTLLLTKKH